MELALLNIVQKWKSASRKTNMNPMQYSGDLLVEVSFCDNREWHSR